METKYCSKCQKTKLKMEFSKNKAQKDGFSNWCKSCVLDKSRTPKAKQTRKNYRKINKEALNNYNKIYRIENKERLNQIDKQRATTLIRRYQALISKAPSRGLKVEMSFEAYCVLVQTNKCSYCEEPLPQRGSGLDRKDNTKGYTIINSVSCCTRCNTMKGSNLTYDEMILIWAIRKGKIQKPML